MRKLLLLSLFFIILLNAHSQPAENRQIPCGTPMSSITFQQQISAINAQKPANKKMQIALNVIEKNCLSSAQLKSLLSSLNNDADRLKLAQRAWFSVSDPANFYDVYDAFSNISTVMRLHDFTKNPVMDHNHNGGNNDGNNNNDNSIFYPDHLGYKGKKACYSPVPESDFSIFLKSYTRLGNDAALINAANDFSRKYCITTTQAMIISKEVQNYSLRLQLLKTLYDRVYDMENYKMAAQLLPGNIEKQELLSYIQNRNVGNTGPVNTECTVAQIEFDQMKKTISSQSFNDTRLKVAKQAIGSRPCFTVSQIIEVIGLFSFEDSRLDIAKFAYEYTTDKQNYYRVADALTYSSSRETLMKFIDEKR